MQLRRQLIVKKSRAKIVKPHETIACDDGLYIELLSQDTDGASVI